MSPPWGIGDLSLHTDWILPLAVFVKQTFQQKQSCVKQKWRSQNAYYPNCWKAALSRLHMKPRLIKPLKHWNFFNVQSMPLFFLQLLSQTDKRTAKCFLMKSSYLVMKVLNRFETAPGSLKQTFNIFTIYILIVLHICGYDTLIINFHLHPDLKMKLFYQLMNLIWMAIKKKNLPV